MFPHCFQFASFPGDLVCLGRCTMTVLYLGQFGWHFDDFCLRDFIRNVHLGQVHRMPDLLLSSNIVDFSLLFKNPPYPHLNVLPRHFSRETQCCEIRRKHVGRKFSLEIGG